MQTIKDRLYHKAYQGRIPLTGAFEVSPMCNFACNMCYVRKTAAEVQSLGGLKPLAFWKDLADQACRAGTVFPLITGGEPFAWPHMRELYEYMIGLGMQVSINSNASCITDQVVSWLESKPPVRINVTLYGASNETYARLCHNPRGFDLVSEGVQRLYDHGINFKFNCSLTPDNCGDLEDMIGFAKRFGKKLKIATYMFPPARSTGEIGVNQARFTPDQAGYYQALTDFYQLEPEQFGRLASNAQAYQVLTPELIAEAEQKEPRQMGCMAGRCSFWIDWQGNLSGCGMMDLPIVSLSDKTLTAAWQEIVDWTNQMRYSAVCANCVNRVICYSCAAMIHNENGSFEGRPVYLCETRQAAAKYYRILAEQAGIKLSPPQNGFKKESTDPDPCEI